MYLDDPSEMVGDYWQRTALPNQSIGRLIIGKKEIIQSIQRDKIVNFMQNNYHPSKMVVSAAGKINHEEFVEKIANSMDNLPQGKKNNRIKASYKGGEYREEIEFEQVHLVLGFDFKTKESHPPAEWPERTMFLKPLFLNSSKDITPSDLRPT